MIKILFEFFRNPYSLFGKGQNETVPEKLDFLKKAILFCLVSCFVILMIIILMIEMPLRNLLDISILANLTHNRQAFRESTTPLGVILDICLAAPFLEEGIFRFILILKSRCLQIISILLILDFITSFHSFYISSYQYTVIVLPILCMLFFYNKLLTRPGEEVLQRKFYNYACWFSCIAFGLAHIRNFAPLQVSLIFLYPFYVLPQMVYGVVLSYAVVRYKSIFLAFLIHAGINSSSEVLRVLTNN